MIDNCALCLHHREKHDVDMGCEVQVGNGAACPCQGMHERLPPTVIRVEAIRASINAVRMSEGDMGASFWNGALRRLLRALGQPEWDDR